MKRCKIARPSQQQQSFFMRSPAISRRRHIALSFSSGYTWLHLYVSLSVSLSLNLYNREWTYFNETHHNSLLPGPHDIIKVTGQRSSQAATAMEVL